MCLPVCVCKLDIGTWKMKVNSMATQGYFCPSILLSAPSQFWIRPYPSISLSLTPPPLPLPVIFLILLLSYISDISVAISAQSHQSNGLNIPYFID